MAFYPEGIQSSYRLQTAEFKNKLDLKITKQDKTYTYVNDQFYSSVFSLRLPKKTLSTLAEKTLSDGKAVCFILPLK